MTATLNDRFESVKQARAEYDEQLEQLAEQYAEKRHELCDIEEQAAESLEALKVAYDVALAELREDFNAKVGTYPEHW